MARLLSGLVTDAKIAGLGLKDLKNGAGAQVAEIRASVERGLYLRLRRGAADGKATLSKRWEFRAKVGKKARWLALGEYPGVSLADARKKASDLATRAEKARKGEGDHPVLMARAERRLALAEPTLREVADEWLALADLRESTKSLHRGNLKSDVYPRIGDAKMKRLTAQHFRDCIDAAVRRGKRGQAAQVYKTLRTLINFALKNRGYIDSDPLANVENPKPYNPRKVKPRAADDEELRTFLRIVDESNISPVIKLSIELQLFTGVRPGEVRGARWEEIHDRLRVWRIPASRVKTGKAFDIHLSPQAAAVLERARAIDSRDGFIFAGFASRRKTAGGKQLGTISKVALARAMARLSERLAQDRIERIRPHDLRRTFRTILSRIGIAPHIAERCLNHADSNPLDAVYNAHEYRPQMIDAWERAGAHIEALRRGGASVTQLQRSA